MNENTPSSLPAPVTLRKRRLGIMANVLLQVVALAALVMMANWMTSRYYRRYDWTRTSYYGLASKTTQVLANLKEPVEIVVCIPTASEQDFVEKTLQDIRNLLKEFQYVAKDKLRVDFVDPQRDMVRARQLVEKYHLDSPDQIIFACGSRHKLIKLDDTVDIETRGYGGPPKVKAFKGEGVFLSGIQTVTEEKPPKVYFLTGHGERDPEKTDPKEGYSILAGTLKRDNIQFAKWNWSEKHAWPTDAGALVIAGPRIRFDPAEVAALEELLRNNGRVLMLLDARRQTGLETLIEKFGVQADDDLAVMPLLGMINVVAMGEEYAQHPITAKMEGINTSFSYCRSIRRKGRAPAETEVTELIKTPSAYWGEVDYNSNDIAFEANRDVRGPLSLAAAVESRQPGGVTLDGMRLVVIGTSSFVNNQNIAANAGNADFFLNSLNWLLRRELQIAVSPKTPQEFRLDMTQRQVMIISGLTIGGLPLAVALLGLAVWMRRRR